MNPRTHLILRVGVALTFLYPPISAFLNPFAWIGYFPPFLVGIVPDPVLLHSFGILELFIGFWLLWGKHLLLPSALATVLLVAIVLFNLPQFDVVFRDLSIAAMALALTLHSWEEKRLS